VENVWKNASTVTLADKILCGNTICPLKKIFEYPLDLFSNAVIIYSAERFSPVREVKKKR
jgi:hypothetical protein